MFLFWNRNPRNFLSWSSGGNASGSRCISINSSFSSWWNYMSFLLICLSFLNMLCCRLLLLCQSLLLFSNPCSFSTHSFSISKHCCLFNSCCWVLMTCILVSKVCFSFSTDNLVALAFSAFFQISWASVLLTLVFPHPALP